MRTRVRALTRVAPGNCGTLLPLNLQSPSNDDAQSQVQHALNMTINFTFHETHPSLLLSVKQLYFDKKRVHLHRVNQGVRLKMRR